jgi:hypothetical protein
MSQFRPYSAQSSSQAHVSDRSSVLASLQLKLCLQTHFLDEMFLCSCGIGDYGLHCSESFSGHNLSAHLREAHNIHGADKAPVFCPWNGCGLGLPTESLYAHLREAHNIHGADKTPVFCPWDGCSLGLRIESLSRHVIRSHLCIAHRCDTCGKSYSRRGRLNKHMKACTGP